MLALALAVACNRLYIYVYIQIYMWHACTVQIDQWYVCTPGRNSDIEFNHSIANYGYLLCQESWPKTKHTAACTQDMYVANYV